MSNTDEDLINHPRHYTSHASGIECVVIARLLPGALSHAITYIWRAGLKDDHITRDLGKAAWWLRDYITTPQPVVNALGVSRLLRKVIRLEPDADRRACLTLLDLAVYGGADAPTRAECLTDLVREIESWAAHASEAIEPAGSKAQCPYASAQAAALAPASLNPMPAYDHMSSYDYMCDGDGASPRHAFETQTPGAMKRNKHDEQSR